MPYGASWPLAGTPVSLETFPQSCELCMGFTFVAAHGLRSAAGGLSWGTGAGVLQNKDSADLGVRFNFVRRTIQQSAVSAQTPF